MSPRRFAIGPINARPKPTSFPSASGSSRTKPAAAFLARRAVALPLAPRIEAGHVLIANRPQALSAARICVVIRRLDVVLQRERVQKPVYARWHRVAEQSDEIADGANRAALGAEKYLRLLVLVGPIVERRNRVLECVGLVFGDRAFGVHRRDLAEREHLL